MAPKPIQKKKSYQQQVLSPALHLSGVSRSGTGAKTSFTALRADESRYSSL
jgi:hypothetical protein